MESGVNIFLSLHMSYVFLAPRQNPQVTPKGDSDFSANSRSPSERITAKNRGVGVVGVHFLNLFKSIYDI